MGSKKQVIIFSDLDGSLLNHSDFKFNKVNIFINKCLDLGIKIIINSSKTKNEIKNVCKDLMINVPFISENGSEINNLDLIVTHQTPSIVLSRPKEQIYNIFQYLNKDIQICLYSATVPNEILNLTNKFMREPIKILVKAQMLTLEGISQYYIALDNDHSKYATLKDIYSKIAVSQCIIYCNSVKRVKDLTDAMISDSFPVVCIHSNMDKMEREKAYAGFKQGNHRVLISANVTARGIDIQQVRTVINFDIPKCANTYLHRIGRSGRWGRKGIGINFVTRRDIKNMKFIEEHYSTEIKELPEDFDSEI